MASDELKPGPKIENPPAVTSPSEQKEGSALPAPGANADDLLEIKKSVEDAASVSGGLWLSYLFVLFYIAIAAGAVTHEDLLLVRPVKMPFLNVELPLKAFFALAPFVVLIIHAYALMHFFMLGKKASRFHNELRRQFPDQQTETQKSGAAPDGANKEIRDKRRWLLPSNIFVQILAGPRELRTGFFGFMLKLMALTTLVVFPILLLLLLQIQFLPFHDVWITNAQRAALFLEIVLLSRLRPPIFADLSVESFGHARPVARALRGFGLVLAWVISIAALWFSVVVATIPREWQEKTLAWLDPKIWPTTNSNLADGEKPETQMVSAHDRLFAGRNNPRTLEPESLLWNILVLPDFDLYEALKIDDPKKLAWKEHLINLRGRHLERAVLWRANLPKADLSYAWLQGASFENARLQGASLQLSDLQGASLDRAKLQGASLVGAHLRGAYIDFAELQGADLVLAKLSGASLAEANLRGASLDRAELQGASLYGADLRGASLYGADLRGASLEGAQLQGTSLADAQLQGALLDLANLKATELSGSFLWRATSRKDEPAQIGAIRLRDAKWEPLGKEAGFPFPEPIPWTSKNYADLRRSLERVPERLGYRPEELDRERRAATLQRIEKLDCDNRDKTLASCDPAAAPPTKARELRTTLERASVDDAAFVNALLATWREIVCEPDAVQVLRGVLLHPRLHYIKTALNPLVAILGERLGGAGRKGSAFVDYVMSKDCLVSASLTDEDKTTLLKIKQEAENNFAPPKASMEEK